MIIPFKKIIIGWLVLLLVIWNFSPVFVLAEEGNSISDNQIVSSGEDNKSGSDVADNSSLETETGEPGSSSVAAEEEEKKEDDKPSEINVSTGQAEALVEVDNNININETEISNSDSSSNNDSDNSTSGDEEKQDGEKLAEGDKDNTATSTLDNIDNSGDSNQDCADDSCEGESNQSDVDIENDNSAQVDSDVKGELNTGKNEIVENLGDINLNTGDIRLISNIFNLINFNVVGSDYLKTAYSLVGNIIGDLDLSGFSLDDLADVVSADKSWQALQAEIGDNESDTADISDDAEKAEVDIDNYNDAEVNNKVLLDLTSGANKIKENSGDVKVVTGNISVVSNMVNIVNTNIVGDGWTLAIINIVGGWTGDLVLPSLTSYIASQTDDFSLTCNDYDCLNKKIINLNQAEVNNNVNIFVDSGNNQVEGNDGEIKVKTGDALAASHIYNQVNTNINKSNWVYGTINVMGNWLGGFYGQPDSGFDVVDKDGSIVFMYNPESESADNSQENTSLLDNSLLTEEKTEDSTSTIFSIENNNKAEVNNIIEILANSGGNVIQGNEGDTDLSTGDVFALSNIMNLVNTNINGSDWTLATINIIGDWNGDLYFGKPDLQIFEVATPAEDPVRPGGVIDYVLTIINKGDAAANGVEVRTKLNPALVRILDNAGGKVDGDSLVWNVDRLGVGEIITKHYKIQIASAEEIDNLDINNPTIKTVSQVKALEADRNLDDNKTENNIKVGGTGKPVVNGYGFPVQASLSNNGSPVNDNQPQKFNNPSTTIYSDLLEIEKSNNSDGLIKQGQSVIYIIKLYNTSDMVLRDVYVFDVMSGPDDEVINEQYWALGDVLPHEEITIDYTNAFAKDAPFGTYKNQTWADGFLDENTYLVFPKKSNLVVIREPLNPENIRVALDYEAEFNKSVNTSDDDYLIITNEGETGLPEGRVVLMYNSEYIKADNDQNGSSFVTPAVNPGESVKLPIKISALKITDRAQLDFTYLLDNSPIVQGTVFYSILPQEEQPDGTEFSNSPNNRLQKSADLLQKKSDMIPKVLGVSEAFAGLSPAPQNQLFGNKLDNWLKDDWRMLIAWVVLILIIIWLSWWNKRLNLNKTDVKKNK